jgi:hypothetical protein
MQLQYSTTGVPSDAKNGTRAHLPFMLIYVTDILSWLAEALPVTQQLIRPKKEVYSL